MFFDITFERDAQNRAIEAYVPTLSGRAILAFTPMPSHALPHTGSPALENKPNFQAYPDIPDDQLQETGGDMDGVCEPGEPCTITVQQALDHRVPMRAPVRMRVTSVKLSRVLAEPLDFYVGTDKDWEIRLDVGDYALQMGHTGWIGPDLRRRLMDAGGPDTDTYAGPVQTELVPEGVQLVVEPGDVLAYPQIANGGFRSEWPGRNVGFHQIEFFLGLKRPALFPGDVYPRDWSPYLFYAESVRQDLLSVMQHHMRNGTSIYAGWPTNKWVWAAEAALEPMSDAEAEDPNTIFGRFGEWYENDESRGVCTHAAPDCDDAFFIWRMVRDSPVFDDALYHRPGETTLVILSEKRPIPEDTTFYMGEVIDPLDVNPVSGNLLIKWRNKDIAPVDPPLFQAFRYALVNLELRMSKGTRVPSETEAATQLGALPDPATTACNNTTVVCLTRNFTGGFPGGN